MEEVSKHLKVDREDGTVSWNGKIIGIFEDEDDDPRSLVTLFVEEEDFDVQGFSAYDRPHTETLGEIEDHLVIGHCLRVQREPWPGRRGM